MARRILCWSLSLAAVLVWCGTMRMSLAQQPGGSTPVLKLEIDQNNQELTQLRSQIQSTRQAMVSIEGREREIMREREEVTHEIALTTELLGELDRRERLLTEQSSLLQTQLASSQQVYQQQKISLARAVRTMYVRGTRPQLELILTSHSFSELMTRMKFNAMLARLGNGIVDRTRQRGLALERDRRELATALASIWETREEAARQSEQLELLEAEHLAVLRELKSERTGLSNRMLEMELNEQKLSYVLADLEQQRQEQTVGQDATSNTLAPMAGNLEWPVQGEVLRGFGRSVHPRFKTVTLNNGLNIAASLGAPVAAVAAGKVEFSDRLPGFGPCVILDHGAGYYTLYAHLDHVFVSVGVNVAAGQVIAEVGRPAGGDQPQLYFEVRHGRTPLDPADWLHSR